MTITYPDALFFSALMREINGAQSSIQIMTFIFRSGYVGETRAKQILDALIAAQARGVDAYVCLDYSRFEADLRAENYATATKLAEAGCTVRLGPSNQTLHTKLAIFDMERVFLGSHNLTRGALSFNREVTLLTDLRDIAKRMRRYFNEVWAWSTRFSEALPPDASFEPVEIALQGFTTVGNEIELAFTVNHTEGVDAFAAVCDTAIDLEGANMGATVTPETRVARVLPLVEPGQMVYLAVRAYSQGNVEATSNAHSMIYQPEEGNGGGGEGGNGGIEPPPPEPLTAPTVTSVTQTSPADVAVTWTFIGAPDLHRFEIQQRNLEQVWSTIGITMDPAARQWTGAPQSMDAVNPVRVVVFNMAEESAASNEMLITLTGGPPPLSPMTLTLVEQITPADIRVHFSGDTPPNWSRYEVEQRTNGQWTMVTDSIEASSRTWEGGPVPYMDAVHPVRMVVFDTLGQSAASNEVTITLML
ncbi:MAG: hypothetical protein AUJ92_10875 [Armatimonadetes bacterium CG2_30_59_28]|nr:hypothetical protein [Armatimonadota bacterium]OIO94096.1 MAG: hypothetical protein AUJ92_10875 [Armatimonadetes bacterium CG2_30_59_28]